MCVMDVGPVILFLSESSVDGGVAPLACTVLQYVLVW